MLFSVEDLVLVGVSNLFNIKVVGHGVGSDSVVDFVSVSVLFLLSVENIVARLPDGVWDISVVGDDVGVVDDSWHELVLGDVVAVVLHLVVGGVSLFFVRVVLCLRLGVDVGDCDLPSPELRLVLVADGILDLIVDDWNIAELVSFAVFHMGVVIFVVIRGEVFGDLDCSRGGANES